MNTRGLTGFPHAHDQGARICASKDPLRAIVPLGKPFGDLEPEDAADTELAVPTRDLEGEDEPALEISERNREISMA
jgi:hypothetical protein